MAQQFPNGSKNLKGSWRAAGPLFMWKSGNTGPDVSEGISSSIDSRVNQLHSQREGQGSKRREIFLLPYQRVFGLLIFFFFLSISYTNTASTSLIPLLPIPSSLPSRIHNIFLKINVVTCAYMCAYVYSSVFSRDERPHNSSNPKWPVLGITDKQT